MQKLYFFTKPVLLTAFLLSLYIMGSAFKLNGPSEPYYIYSDQFDNGVPSGMMGASNGSGLSINVNSTENPFKGKYCLKVTADGSEGWSGVFIQKGATWKVNVPADNPLANLNGYKYLVFHARSDKNYTIAKLGMGEGKEENAKEEGAVALTPEWKRFVLEMKEADRGRINGLFLIVFEGAGTLFLDEVYYAGPEFERQPDDIFFGERTEPLDPNSFYVFSDRWDNGIPSGYMGEKNGASMKIDDNWKENPYLGPKCVKIHVGDGETWRGLHVHMTGAWNASISDPSKLPDLSQYDFLEFYARADSKDAYILTEIGMGGGGIFEEQRSDSFLEIGKKWKRYQIPLKGIERSTVNTVLFLVLPKGTLYLDEIRYIKAGEKPEKKGKKGKK